MHSRDMGAPTALFRIFLLRLIAVSNPAFAYQDCNFPAIFNFGDSNSDTGGLSAAFSEFPLPHGITFFHGPAGRYCDGRLLIDFVANSLGLPFLHPYLDSMRANFSQGANFATAGSTIRAQNTTSFSPFSLNIQSKQYNQFKSRSNLALNQDGAYNELLPKDDYFSHALYTFDIGQNDLTAGSYLSKTSEEVSASLSDILDRFSAAVRGVYEEGGRTFWIHSTGPLGCLAYVLAPRNFTEDQLDRIGCAIPWNELAQQFNKKLNETVVQLRNDLPLAAITYVDVYSAKYSLFSQSVKFGFKHNLTVCCGSEGKYNYNRSALCGGKAISCEDPSAWINWDGAHYTEAANQLVFKLISDGAFSDPPIPLNKSCNRVAY